MQLIQAKTKLQILKIHLLYRAAFPKEERKPFSIITMMQAQGKTDIWYAQEKGRFLGFATTINDENLILLDYLAIKKSVRGKGYGTRFMKEMLSIYQGKGFFVEIELVDQQAENYEERLKRKQFYLACGMEDLHVSALVFKVPMELLGKDCTLDFQSYHDFYRDNYTVRSADNIQSIKED